MPATQHQHHFDDLSPDDFERLIYWLVERSGEFDHVQWYGGARDKGRDVVAYRHTASGREKWYIQAKRYKSISFATLRDELDKLAGHAKAEPDFRPHTIVFATACDVPPQAKDQAEAHAKELGLPALYFWGRLELDERLKAQPQTEKEFFGPRASGGIYTPPPLPAPEAVPEPGALPPGSWVPFVRNALFTGRKEALKDLARALLYGGAASTLITQAIAGMGGVGKTQLAVEFAYRYGRYFRGVHWLNAARPEMLAAEVVECGLAMRLADWPDEQPEQVACTLKAWSASGPRLVVADNLEDVKAAGEWLARLGGGAARVLVTARRSSWPRELGLAALQLAVFSPEESLALLRKYLPGERAGNRELARLAERLWHLPLALKLAGCYLEGHPSLKVGSYVDRLADALDDRSMEAWRDEQGRVPSEQDRDLLASFMLSWERVTDEAARRVFLAAGWCAPNEAIPGEVLERAAGLDAEGCDGAVGLLAGLGLVEREAVEVGPKVHPLLAEFGRKVLTLSPGPSPSEGEGKEPPLAALARALVVLATEANRTGLPARFGLLRPHVEEAAASAEKAGLKEAGMLWGNLGYHRRMMADYAGARMAHERALGIDERVYGPDHPDVAIRINNLGSVLHDLGDLAGARVAYERALAIGERVYGPDHPAAVTRVNNLGRVLHDLGDLAGARAAYEQALAIAERVYGLDHPAVATVLNNLGSALHDLGDLAGARAVYERALAIDEQVYGPDHPNVARDVNNLGSVLRGLEDLAGARAAYERAMAIFEKALGPNHPNVATPVNNLGSVMLALGNLAGARAAYERALAIFVKFLPADHPNIRITRENLESLDRRDG